jgi:hypothetical protein
MKSLFILFIAALTIIPASAQNVLRFETLNSDKAILAYVMAFSESSAQSTSITYNKKNILEINKSPILDSSDSHFLFSFTTFGLKSIEAGMHSTPETEDPKIGEDTIGLPQDKIEKLKQFAESKGLRFSEQWFSVSKPKGHIIGSSKRLHIYSRVSKCEENSEIIKYIITEIYGINIEDGSIKGKSFREVKAKPNQTGAGNLVSLGARP